MLMLMLMLLGRYDEPSVRPPTLQEYVSAQLRSLETGYKKDIWRNWLESYNGTTLDPTEGERREQIFFDDFFDKTETFFNQTVPQLCDKVKGFVQKTLGTGDTSIGDFIMSHLLPVEMDTIVKFVKFLRCSWTSDPPQDYGHIERTIARLIDEYNPQTLFGIEGLDIGTDADIIQKNLLNQVGFVCVWGVLTFGRPDNFFQRLPPHFNNNKNHPVECGC